MNRVYNRLNDKLLFYELCYFMSLTRQYFGSLILHLIHTLKHTQKKHLEFLCDKQKLTEPFHKE